jgi:hypothetical protein
MTASNKVARAAPEQSTSGQRRIWGTDVLGQWVKLQAAQPWHTHLLGCEGCWVGQLGNRGTPWSLHLNLKV